MHYTQTSKPNSTRKAKQQKIINIYPLLSPHRAVSQLVPAVSAACVAALVWRGRNIPASDGRDAPPTGPTLTEQQ